VGSPRGLFARALNGSYCDVILQAPTEYDMAGVTSPYYRTGYVVVQRTDAHHKVTSLDDPVLKTMRIGVHLFANDAENSPPAMVLSSHGVVGNLVGFGTTFVGNKDRPEDIIRDGLLHGLDHRQAGRGCSGRRLSLRNPPSGGTLHRTVIIRLYHARP
jgi:hypothetical protein